jgi:glutamate:GABA antiporter
VTKQKRVLSVFSLVMINVIAVDSLRTLPITAKLGYSLIFYYLVAALAFFIPVALVSAELATAFPETGGIYIWVREAFGRKAGFMTIWLQWIYNVVWYPTILVFLASTITYLFAPELANNKLYLFISTICFFWIFTLLNCYGMKISGIISTISATVGTLLPIIGIACLGIFWLSLDEPVAISFNGNWLPNFTEFGHLTLFSAVLFSLFGIEMSSVHAEEVKNPQRDYPRALFYSTILILISLVTGALAIALVVPEANLNVVSGLIDAYSIFFKAFHISWMTPITAGLIVIGGLGAVAAWIIGPTKGLLVAARDNCIPHVFSTVNKHGVPVALLLAQGLIVTLISTVFVFFDNISSAYWMLSDLCAQLALLVYVFMFAAALRLRYIKSFQQGAYKVPGGNAMMWFLCSLGIICCLSTIAIGFVPPSQIDVGNIWMFEGFLIGGLVVFVVLPWLLAKKNEPISKDTNQ